MPPANSVLLSDAVLERMPFLRNANVRFFDFGNVQILDHSTVSEPTPQAPGTKQAKSTFAGVVVITDEILAIASFPAATGAPVLIPHFSVVGVARDGASVVVRNGLMNDIKLTLPKCDAFVVHLIGIQDRAMNRTLRLAGEAKGSSAVDGGGIAGKAGGGGTPRGGGTASTDPNAIRRAMSLAEEVAGVSSAATDASMERLWGVIRLGRGSSRAGPPTTELDEGSDASSVQTIQHVADSPRDHDGFDSVDGGSRPNSARRAAAAAATARAGDGGDGGAAGAGALHDADDDVPLDEVEVPAMATDAASLKRRLWYFFMYYDQSRLGYIDTLVAMHGGTDGKQLMKELEQQYGPEPHRFRWSIRDQTIYQREINSQLRAQLARAQDELLLLKENPHEKTTAVARVLSRKDEIVAQMLGESSLTTMSRSGSSSSTVQSSPAAASSSSNKDAWRDMFSPSAQKQQLSKLYNVLSFHDVVEPPERAMIEWSLVAVGAFWNTLKQQVVALGPVRTNRPLIEVTNEDVREMLVCNRDFFLAWIAEAHGECTLHLRHVDGNFCFMSLSEAFPHVTVGL